MTPAVIIGASVVALVVHVLHRASRPPIPGSDGSPLGDVVAAVRRIRAKDAPPA